MTTASGIMRFAVYAAIHANVEDRVVKRELHDATELALDTPNGREKGRHMLVRKRVNKGMTNDTVFVQFGDVSPLRIYARVMEKHRLTPDQHEEKQA
jgi:hypothetical protein